jgi:DNA-directed RNA polymerase specialized sigma subunit, sigma24 homolog
VEAGRGSNAAVTESPKFLGEPPDADSAPAAVDPDAVARRVAGGDEEALASFILERARFIRHRYRQRAGQRLLGTATHDIVSTVFRRTLQHLRQRPLEVQNGRGLWRLVELIAERAGVDRRRAASAAWRATSAVRGHEPTQPLDRSEAEDVQTLIHRLDPIDREIARLWANGMPHNQIAEILGLTADGVRQRWRRAKLQLRRERESTDAGS